MRSIVFSTVSHLDMYTGEDRKDRWRPLNILLLFLMMFLFHLGAKEP